MLPLSPSKKGRHAAPQRRIRPAVTALLAFLAATTLGITVPLVGGSAEAVTTVSKSFSPTADVMVSSVHNRTNYGKAASLQEDGSPIVRSYLKFTVSGTSGIVQRVTLRLQSLTTSRTGVTVSTVIGNGWTEAMVFANAYAIGSKVTTSGPPTKGRPVDIDVTSAVTGNGTYSLVLTTPYASNLSFLSRDTRMPPRLTVTTTSVTADAVEPVMSAPPVVPSASPTTAPTLEPTLAPSPTVPTAAPAPTGAPSSGTRALHIHHGWDLATPAQVARNAAIIDSRPLDGITVRLPTLTDDTLSSIAHSEAEYAAALSAMPHLQRVRHNFVIVRTMHPLAWYDDAAWATTTQNFANLARAAAAKGEFDGIFLDTEWYGSGAYPWNFGSGSSPWAYSDTAGSTPGHTANDANAKVGARGRATGDAVAAAWPNAVLMATYGPWVGETKTSSAGGWGAFGYNDIAWTNELMGSFTGGLVDAVAAHPTMTYADGGEVYQAHTPAEYATAYKWMKTGLAASGSPVVRNPSTYSSAVSVGFGVYDKDMRVNGWPTMSASLWQTVLTNALSTGDRYVWSYSEAYDWLATGWPATPVPATILTATANAMAAAV